jgi:hypothetical protein
MHGSSRSGSRNRGAQQLFDLAAEASGGQQPSKGSNAAPKRSSSVEGTPPTPCGGSDGRDEGINGGADGAATKGGDVPDVEQKGQQGGLQQQAAAATGRFFRPIPNVNAVRQRLASHIAPFFHSAQQAASFVPRQLHARLPVAAPKSDPAASQPAPKTGAALLNSSVEVIRQHSPKLYSASAAGRRAAAAAPSAAATMATLQDAVALDAAAAEAAADGVAEGALPPDGDLEDASATAAPASAYELDIVPPQRQRQQEELAQPQRTSPQQPRDLLTAKHRLQKPRTAARKLNSLPRIGRQEARPPPLSLTAPSSTRQAPAALPLPAAPAGTAQAATHGDTGHALLAQSARNRGAAQLSSIRPMQLDYTAAVKGRLEHDRRAFMQMVVADLPKKKGASGFRVWVRAV